MTPLQKMVTIGAGLGLSRQIAALFPEPKASKVLTAADHDRIAKAEAKRKRKAAKLSK